MMLEERYSVRNVTFCLVWSHNMFMVLYMYKFSHDVNFAINGCTRQFCSSFVSSHSLACVYNVNRNFLLVYITYTCFVTKIAKFTSYIKLYTYTRLSVAHIIPVLHLVHIVAIDIVAYC